MHLVIQFLILFHQISDSKVQTLKFRNLKFEQIFSYISGVDTYALQIFDILFSLTVLLNLHFLFIVQITNNISTQKTPGSPLDSGTNFE